MSRLVIEYLELRLYSDHSATSYELLPNYVGLNFDVKYNEVGVIEFDYPLAEAKAAGIEDQVLIGVVCGFSDGTSIEPERYVVEGTDDDKVSDDTRLMTVNGRATLGPYMEDANVYPSNWPVASPTGHEFVDNNIGTIMRTLIQRAKDRGCFPFLNETSFSGAADSGGQAWNALHTQNYATGTSYLQILKDFMELGYVDAWMEQTNLRLRNGGTRGTHIQIGTVELRPAHNVSEMQTTTKSDESATTILIEGEEGTAVERHDSAFQTTLGRRRERYVQQGGIADAGVLTLLADAELGLRARIPTEETLGVSNVGLTPFLDFGIGDWVWVRYDTDQDAVERRVRQIAVSVDESRAITLGLTLNTILYEQDVALQRRMDQYTGKGSSYGPTPNTSVDVTRPNPPVGVSVTPGNYWDSKTRTYVGAFVVNWTAPTQNVDGTALDDLEHYEVTWKYSGETTWSAALRTSETETSLGYSPVTPGRTLVVRVRAVDKSANTSDWSSEVTQTVPADATPPPKPSTPVTSSRLGTIRVYWDGKTSTGTDMPEDFWFASVHLGSSPTFTPSSANQVATLAEAGQVIAGTDLAYGTTHYARVVPFDVSGNAGPASDAHSTTVLALVDTDVIGKVLDGAKIKDGSVTASEAIIGQTITGALIKGLAVETGHLAANAVTTPKLDVGAVTADKMSIGSRGISVLKNSYMEDVKTDASGVPLASGEPASWKFLYNATDVVLEGETTSPISGTRSMKVTINNASRTPTIGTENDGVFSVVPGQKWYLRATFRAVSNIPAGKSLIARFHTAKPPSWPYNTLDSNASWSSVTKQGPFTAGETVTLESTFTVAADHTKGGVSIGAGGTGAIGDSFLVDSVEAWPATTDSQITDITPGKITTGVLQAATRIVAGSFTGARVETTGTGITAYKADGATKTFDLSASTGNLWLSGTFTTEATGGTTRIVLGSYNNPYQGNTAWNTIQFYPQDAAWDPGLIWTAFGSDAGPVNWGVLQLASPKLGTREPARINLRSEEQTNNTLLEMSANIIRGSANTYEWGDPNNTAVVHKMSYAGADGSQTMSFRSAGNKRVDFRYGTAGTNVIFSGTETGARERLDLFTEDLWFDLSSALGNLYMGPASQINNRPILACPAVNSGLTFTQEVIQVTSLNGGVWIPIWASNFVTKSDIRDKSNLRLARESDRELAVKRKGSAVSKPDGPLSLLEKVRALPVYDYETPHGQKRKFSEKVGAQGHTQRGVMAQHVQEFWPDGVSEDDIDGTGLGVDLYYMLSTLWAGVQELADRVDELKGSA